jgi:hypothetical protein
MVKCGVLFEVRTEFLSTTQMSFGFKRLKSEFGKNISAFNPYLKESTGRGRDRSLEVLLKKCERISTCTQK